MRISAANKKKIDALIVIGWTEEAAKAVVLPKEAAKPKVSLVKEPAPEPTPAEILISNGFTPEEAAALIGETPVVAPTPDEVRAEAVAQAGFTFAKGRIYLHDALIEAAIAAEDEGFQIVPNIQGAGAVLVFKDAEKGLALQSLFKRA